MSRVSKGKFRYIRSAYRNLQKLKKFKTIYGDPTPITFTITDLSSQLVDPVSQPTMYSGERDVSTSKESPGLPIKFFVTKEGPTDNVTYI